MSIIERIEKSFENGEDFNFMQSDVQELKDLAENAERYGEIKRIIEES